MNLIDTVTEAGSDVIAFEFQALTTFNYVGRDFDTTVSDVVNVSYDTKKAEDSRRIYTAGLL